MEAIKKKKEMMRRKKRGLGQMHIEKYSESKISSVYYDLGKVLKFLE